MAIRTQSAAVNQHEKGPQVVNIELYHAAALRPQRFNYHNQSVDVVAPSEEPRLSLDVRNSSPFVAPGLGNLVGTVDLLQSVLDMMFRYRAFGVLWCNEERIMVSSWMFWSGV